MRKLRVGRLFLIISSLASLTTIGLGSLFISMIAANTRVKTAEEQVMILLNALGASLQNDLLASNLYVASDRAGSIFSPDSLKWTCFYIQNVATPTRTLLMQTGNPNVCRMKHASRQSTSIYFDSAKRVPAFELTIVYAPDLMPVGAPIWMLILPGAVLLIGLLSVVLLTMVAQRLFAAVSSLIRADGRTDSSFFKFQITELVEITGLLNDLDDKRTQLLQAHIDRERAEALRDVAAQVSHDIRSPLSALNLAVANLDGLEEERRILIGQAAKRINDIANGLLRPGQVQGPETTLVGDVVSQIVAEKRHEFRADPGVSIKLESRTSYGQFIRIAPAELARVLSNLINNAYEARANAATLGIDVVIDGNSDRLKISVRDDGAGMPEAIIGDLGMRGVTYGKSGKQSGSGIGVYHAKKVIESAGGNLRYVSKLGEGTTAIIELPRVQPPNWFLHSLAFLPASVFVTVDADPAIHRAWEQKLVRDRIQCRHVWFCDLEAFEAWCRLNHLTHVTYAVDLWGERPEVDGFEVIARLGIQSSAVLVTSNYLDPEVQTRSIRAGVPILPKHLIGEVPMPSVAARPADQG